MEGSIDDVVNNLINSSDIRIVPGITPSNAWNVLGSLLVLLIWVTFASLYFSRFVGLLISSLINYYMRFAKIEGSLSIGSFSISPLAGKVVFRGVVYACDDWSIRLNDGFIILAYWKFLPNTKAARCCTSRVSIHINGMQMHIYNQLWRYSEVAKMFRLSHLLPEEAKIEVTKKSQMNFERLWALIGVIKVNCSSGRIVLGNELLPYMLVVNLENLKSNIFVEESRRDHKLINMKASMENVRMVLLKHPNFKKERSEPPRTMGDGFVLMQTAELTLVYFEDILGIEESNEEGIKEDERPVWESIWKFGHNTQFAYGPWAEKQRAIIINFFLPPLLEVAPITDLPKKGQKRIRIVHEIRMSLLHDATLDLYFTRGEELEGTQSRLQAGSSIDATIWWITREEGFKWSAKGALLNIQSSTTLLLSPFLNAETLTFEVIALYPRTSNGKQSWTLNLMISKATLYFVAEHIQFISDLSSQWVGYESADLCSFVPYVMTVHLQVQDFEVILLLNEGNWIERKVMEDNWMGAIVGNSLSLKCVLPYDDFAPEIIRILYDVKLRGDCAVRMNLPQSRVSSAIYSSLLVHPPEMNAKPSKYGRSTYKKNDWTELWRTESIDLLIEHKYHPTSGSFTSEVPSDLLNSWLPPRVIHPFQLQSDIITVNVDVHSSEVIITGTLIRMVINLIENYCSSYDKMTEVGGGDEAEKKLPYWRGDRILERLRPLSVIFALRLHHIRGFCMSHSIDQNNSMEAIVEEIEIEVDKNKERSLIQVSVGGGAARLTQHNSSTNSGLISLSSMQVRGHALFSPLGVSLDMGSVEYSWTLQLLIGTITADVSIPQMVRIGELVHTLINQIGLEDDKKRIPARLTRCHHGGLSISCRESPTHECPSDALLQYRLIRISIDNVNILMRDESTNVLFDISNMRLRICNWRRLHIGIGLRRLGIKILMNTIGEKTIEAANSHINNVDFVIKMKEEEKKNKNEKSEWIMKHDENSRRLPFVWNDSHICPCLGNHSFFHSNDYVGEEWRNGGKELAVIVPFEKSYYGYMESLLRKGEIGCESQPRAVYMTRKTNEEMGRCEYSSSSSRGSSFHSLSNERRLNSCEVYSKILSTWTIKNSTEDFPQLGLKGEIDDWIGRHSLHVNKVTEGIGEEVLKTNDSDVKIRINELDDTNNVILMEGCIANEICMMITPLGLEGINELIDTVMKTLKKITVSADVQNLLTKCADGGHFHPVLPNRTIHKGSIMDSLVVNVYLPRINISLVSSSSSSLSSSSSSSSTTSYPSLFIISVDNIRLYTCRGERSQFITTMSALTAQLLLLSSREDKYDKKNGQLHGRIERRTQDITITNDIHSRTILEVYIPKPSAHFDRPHKKDEVHLLQIEINNIDVKIMVRDNNKGDLLYSLLSPILNEWSNSFGLFIMKMKKNMSHGLNVYEWRLVKLLVLSFDEKKNELKDKGIDKTKNGDMISVRYQSTLSSCPSCYLSLTLLKYLSNYESFELEDKISVEDNMRKESLMNSLSNWQKPISAFIPIPDDVNMKDFEIFDDDDGKRKEEGKDDVITKGGVQGGDLYQYLRSHRSEKKKKKEKEERSGANFDPHVFFYSWYNFLKLDDTVIDGLSSLRLKAKLTLGNFEIGVVELRLLSSPSSLSYITHSSHPLFSLERLSSSLDIDLIVTSEKKLVLPSQIHLTVNSETRIDKVQFTFALTTFSLVKELIEIGGETWKSFNNGGGGGMIHEDDKGEGGNISNALWIDALKKNIVDNGCIGRGDRKKRSSRMKSEIFINARIIIQDIIIDSTIFNLCSSILIDNLKAQAQLCHTSGTDMEGSIEGDTRKATISFINLASNTNVEECHDILGGTIHEAKIVLRKKKKEKTNIVLKINSVMGELLMGVIPLYELIEKYYSKVEKEVVLTKRNIMHSYFNQEQINNSSFNCTQSTPIALPDIGFKLVIGSIELGGRLTETVKITFKFDKPSFEGFLGSSPRGHIRLDEYRLIIDVSGEVLRLPLPKVHSMIIWRRNEDAPSTHSYSPKKGYFIDVLINIGSVSHTFPTDVLNVVLHMEMALRYELKRFHYHLNNRRNENMEVNEESARSKEHMKENELNIKNEGKNESVLFALRIESSHEPWLSLISTTPANTGVQLQITSLLITLTNRWKSKCDRLIGLIQMQWELRLGQILSTMTDMDKFASFSTQLSLERKEGGDDATDTFNCLLTRPLLIVHPRGIERAILLWLHCKDSFDHWRANKEDKIERMMSMNKVDDRSLLFDHSSSSTIQSLSISPPIHDISLSLSILHFSLRVPLRTDSCLLLVLKKADGCVAMKGQFGLRASFDAFKITILENVTQEAMLDYADYSDEDSGSNFLFFPKGVLELASEAASSIGYGPTANVKVKGGMSGMIVDIDQRVGRLAKLLVSAFSQIGEMNEELGSSIPSLVSAVSSSDDEDLLSQMKKLDYTQDKEKWMEKKIRDQSELVKAFVDCNASEAKVEEERKVLRRMENARLKYFMKKIRMGESIDDKMKTKKDKDERTKGINPLEKVNMNIEAQLTIESGKCSLRTPSLTSRPSNKDLGMKIGRGIQTNTSNLTTILIPSVSSNGVYHSGMDKERGSLDIAISLQSIPIPQILTPHIADFLEQVLDPLPSSWPHNSDGVSLDGSISLITPSSLSSQSPLIDTLPFDFLIVLNVHASEINFLGQQPRSSAADCRLQLPSLSIMASSRLLCDRRVSLDVSASLSKFSLSVYSPHQTTNHDALSLSLDHISFVVSRSKNAGVERENRVEIISTASIGNALISYDGRRISELVSFPKPWYRAAVVRRLFFGDKYMQPRGLVNTDRLDGRSEKRWRTKIVVGVRWKELDVKIQMGNTMGATVWNVSNGECRTRIEMSSERYLSIDGMFALNASRLLATNGAISGDINISKLIIKLKHTRSAKNAPMNSGRIEVKEVLGRLEWMSRTILLLETTLPSISFCDLWSFSKTDNMVNDASMSINISLSWKSLQLVITSSTIGDLEKMAMKLVSFFKDQLRSGVMMWETTLAETSREFRQEGNEVKEAEEDTRGGIGYWQSLLDMMIHLQNNGVLPFPTGDGRTHIKGCIHVTGDSLSLALMNGEMTSTAWALFHFNLPSLLFSTQACLMFRGEGDDKELVRHVLQRAVITLGKSGERNDKQATVCRVQSKGGGMASWKDIREILDNIIGDSLNHSNKNTKSVLELFQFPTLEAVYESEQEENTAILDEDDEEDKPKEVRASFTCQFYGVISVQTELNAQLGFLPDLINSYKKKEAGTLQNLQKNSNESSNDERIHKCIEWDVEPRIGFIDKFRWEPPVVDEVLKKLEIFDHRNTIPKVVQRALMDSLDDASATIIKQLLKFANESKTTFSDS